MRSRPSRLLARGQPAERAARAQPAEPAACAKACAAGRAGCLRRAVAIALAMLALVPSAAAAAWVSPPCRGEHRVGAWETSPSDAPAPGFADQSLRLIVHPTLGGRRVRVRLSNRFGSSPVTFAAATIARRSAGASLEPGTTRTLSFNGAPAVTIPRRRRDRRRSAELSFEAFQDLAVSVHVQGASGPGHAAPDRPQTSLPRPRKRRSNQATSVARASARRSPRFRFSPTSRCGRRSALAQWWSATRSPTAFRAART